MFKQIHAGMAAVAMLALSGCAAQGGWMGAEAEKGYDKDLEIKRLAEVQNNDDYYQFEAEGRIYVLSDAKDYAGFRKTGEVPYSSKKIGGGPGGKTVVFGLVKNETKQLEKNPRMLGAAQKMFEGTLDGLTKGFFGVIEQQGAYYVFSDWASLKSFRDGGKASGFTAQAPDGNKVIYANAASEPEDTAARFAKLFN